MAGETGFKDHFSSQSGDYQRYRPDYPPELYEWLARAAPGRGLAVDLATGNGPAARGLAVHFGAGVATDASAAQIREARPHPKVAYRCEPAEATSVGDGTADLVTAAQAAHWFDWSSFCAEMRRILKPGGLLAIWCYELFTVDPAIERLIADFSRDVVGPYWPPERRHVEEHYRYLPLPFPAIETPEVVMRAEWDWPTAMGYLGPWSAVQRSRSRTGRDPLPLVERLLAEAWGPGSRSVHWPLVLRPARARKGLPRPRTRAP